MNLATARLWLAISAALYRYLDLTRPLDWVSFYATLAAVVINNAAQVVQCRDALSLMS